MRLRIKRLAFVLAVPALLIVSFPVWFPWILKPLAEANGVSVSTYDRLGWSRLRLLGGELAFSGGRLSWQSLEIELPHLWLWHRYAGAPTGKPQVSVSDWELELDAATGDSQPVALSSTLDGIAGILEPLKEWVPRAAGEAGRLRWATGEVEIATWVWENGTLDAVVQDPGTELQVRASVAAQTSALFTVGLSLPDWDTTAQAKLTHRNDEWRLEGTLGPQTNSLEFEATWGVRGALPDHAWIRGRQLSLPSVLITNTPARSATVDLEGQWTNGVWSCSLAVESSLTTPQAESLSSLSAQVEATGAPTGITLRRCEIRSSFGDLKLARQVAVSFSSGTTNRLTSRWDLALTPGPDQPLDGSCSLQLRLTPRGFFAREARLDFDLLAPQLCIANSPPIRLQARGRLQGTNLYLDPALATLSEGNTLTVRGQLDLLNQQILDGQLHYDGGLAEGWAPPSLNASNVTLAVAFEGPWQAPQHEGSVAAAGIQLSQLYLPNLAFHWNGSALNIPQWTLSGGETGQLLEAQGAVALSRERNAITGTIAEARWIRGEGIVDHLVEPAAFTVGLPGPTNAASLRIPRLVLEGSANRRLSLFSAIEWPRRGEVKLEIQNLQSTGFGGLDIPPTAIDRADLNALWDDGPIDLELTLNARTSLDTDEELQVSSTINWDPRGLQIDLCEIREESSVLARLTGSVPVQFWPAGPERWRPLADDPPLQLSLETLQSDTWWSIADRFLSVNLRDPILTAEIAGTLTRPSAHLSASALSVALPHTNAPIEVPPIENIRLEIESDLETVRITRGTFEVVDNPARLSGAYEVGASSPTEWVRRLANPDWRKAEAQIDLPRISLQTLASLAPEWLLPLGQMSLHGSLEKGGKLRGALSLTNAATRPVGPFASLRDVQGALRFEEDTAHIDQFSASYSGQPVTLTGYARMSESDLPWFDLNLKGKDLSLVRRSGLFLRGDLDLRFAHTNNSPPRVSGDVTLRDSLLFQDVRTLVDIDLNQPERRPPYFSITEPPLDGWELDLRIKGDRFLRAISPVFSGQISAGLELSGTLREPLAVGEVSVPQGRVSFPFGTLDLQQGRVSLSRENPHEPQLSFQGSGYNFGYLVKVDLSGTATNPNLDFSSIPPLTPKEILLMLSAGEVPSQSITFSTADKASRIGFYLGKELLSQVVGGSQSAERLTVRSGEHVTDDGRLTYTIEYRLSDRWSAIGEYNRFRDINTGLKYRIYSR